MSEWLTVDEAARHAKCGTRSIYNAVNAVNADKLRAARLGGRRELRFLAEWVDAWLLATVAPVIVNANAPGAGTHEGVITGGASDERGNSTPRRR